MVGLDDLKDLYQPLILQLCTTPEKGRRGTPST